MVQKRTSERISERETASRLESLLRGAFAGSPTPLKDIPTRWGEQRAKRKDRPRRKRRQRKSRAA
jgi:hypothetical protein